MNIKNYSLKAMCAALACTTVLSSMLAAYATNTTVYETPMDDSTEINAINTLADDSTGTGSSDSGWTTEENSFEDIKVTYQQSSSYAVTIPKTIALDTKKQAAYSVKVSGDIDANQRVYVAPVDGITDSENLDFHMKDLSGKKADVVATVTQNKTYWSSGDVTAAYEETQNCVSASDLTAGTWEGTFQVEIRLESNTTQGGEESDPYEVAPATAYSNWNYTLDDENSIITLNYYTGSETDVIVYANYPVGEKTYKTCISSNKCANNDTAYNTRYMFNGSQMKNCNNIVSIVFSKDIDTSNVTNMGAMFTNCYSLTNLELGTLNTSNVTNMSYMFSGCKAITDLNLNGFDTSNVTNMRDMFANCESLTSLDLSNFNTSKVTDMESMFSGALSLLSLDISNFDTSNVTRMGFMFSSGNAYYSMSLTSLDLSSFDTKNTIRMCYMFQRCPSLQTIYVTKDKWTTSQADVSGMFNSCGTSSVTYK